MVGGCAEPPIASKAVDAVVSSGVDGPTVSVISRGWHTDIALPTPGIAGPMAALAQAFPGVRFLVFGFGDRGYLMARDDPILGMMAAVFPGPGAFLVTALRVPPAAAFGADHVVTLRLSHRQFCAVTAFIQAALAIGPDGRPVRLGDGPYPGSAFYASTDIYDALNDCNHWTASALRSGGLPADADGVLFASQVMDLARRIAAGQQRAAPPPDTTSCT